MWVWYTGISIGTTHYSPEIVNPGVLEDLPPLAHKKKKKTLSM